MRFGIRTMDEIEVHGKTVLLRVDLNQPVDRATDTLKSTARIEASVPTIRELSDKGAKVVVLAHQGSDIEYKNYYCTRPHAKVLTSLLGREVQWIDDVCGPAAREAIKNLENGQILLLDNVRHVAEEQTLFEMKLKLTHELYSLLSRIDWLITTLLKISRLDAGTVRFKQEEITMEQLLQNACKPLLIPVELRSQQLTIRASGKFTGDIAWTCEAVSNIVKNCIEHTPEHGCIQIEAAENPLYSQIMISDNGSGIDPADLPHIFERFYKGKNADGNSFGVGLALARMIVIGQNGTIKAENGKSAGASFILRFYKGTV